MVTVSRNLMPISKRDLNFNSITLYILINPIALWTDKGDVLEKKICMSTRLTCAYCYLVPFVMTLVLTESTTSTKEL